MNVKRLLRIAVTFGAMVAWATVAGTDVAAHAKSTENLAAPQLQEGDEDAPVAGDSSSGEIPGPEAKSDRGNVLLSDSLTDAASGLLEKASSNPRVTVGYGGGEYRIAIPQPAPGVRLYRVALPGRYVDAAIAVDGRVVATPAPAGNTQQPLIALECRVQPDGSRYEITVQPAVGRFRLYRFDGESAVTLVDGLDPAAPPSAAINRGDAVNRLELSCVGNTITASVNGTSVGTAIDDVYAEGGMRIHAGVTVGSQPGPMRAADARFSNLLVTAPR